MKRLLSVLLILMLEVALLAGCSTPSAKPDSSSKPAGEISGTINFYYWGEEQKAGMEAMVALFEDENPKINVEMTLIPWGQYWTKLQTSLPSGTGPDVMWMNTKVQDYVSSDLLYDLTPLIERDNVDLSKFPNVITELYTLDGKVWGIPKDFDTIGMWYNKAIFDEMDVAYPKAGWTWEDFLDTAKKLTNENHYGAIIDMNNTQSGSGNFIRQAGGIIIPADQKSLEINSPAQIEALQFCRDLMYKYKVCPTSAELTEMAATDMFIAGKGAMVSDGSWNASLYYEPLGENLDVVELPQHKQKGNQINGLSFVMSKKTKNLEAAWQFLKFTATKEAQAATAKVVIPAYEGAADSWLAMYPSVNLKVFIDATSYAVTQTMFIKNSDETLKVYGDALATINLEPNSDIKSLLDDAQSKMMDLLK